jgi:hypothetical protein
MPSLSAVAKYVRSKNAGPFWVTIDIFCGDTVTLGRVASAASLDAKAIAALYGVDAEQVERFREERLHVLKISFPRPVAQGSTLDRDSHAGQYFIPLLDAQIP